MYEKLLLYKLLLRFVLLLLLSRYSYKNRYYHSFSLKCKHTVFLTTGLQFYTHTCTTGSEKTLERPHTRYNHLVLHTNSSGDDQDDVDDDDEYE